MKKEATKRARRQVPSMHDSYDSWHGPAYRGSKELRATSRKKRKKTTGDGKIHPSPLKKRRENSSETTSRLAEGRTRRSRKYIPL